MKKYKYLLWDIDGTVLNFKAAEKTAIRSLFGKFNLGECTDSMLGRYSEINKKYWKWLELGKIDKNKMFVERFEEFFKGEGLNTEIAGKFNEAYQLALGDTIVFNDDAYNIINEQKKDSKIIIVTNGTAVAQEKKLELSGIKELADYIFISEVVGYEKPGIKFFENVFSKAGITDLSEALIIGDSLTSDIQGGINAGIDTCWYNPDNIENDSMLEPTYIISNLQELV